MTELETLRRARMYLDKLARGIDPISDQEIPDDSVLNQARLARCFFYVSEVLGQVIDNGGVVGTAEKQPFRISPDQIALVPITEEPVSISDFIARLYEAAGAPDMKKPGITTFLNWLESRGFLMKVMGEDGKRRRVPAEAGTLMGILSVRRQGRDGAYDAVLYSECAQRFLLDHLGEILSGQTEGQ